jgi:hypothetical protein
MIYLHFEVILGAGGMWQAVFLIMKHEDRIAAYVKAINSQSSIIHSSVNHNTYYFWRNITLSVQALV